MTLLSLFALLSALAAVLAAIVAWRVWRRERDRSDARVAALASIIDPAPAGVAMQFSPPRATLEHDHPLLKVAAGFVVVVAVLLLVGLLTDGRGREAAVAAEPAEPALALLSMRDERENGTLTVTGLVRNQGAAAADGVVATVLVFDRAGTFLASARAPLDTVRLDPGEDSPFRVAVPRARDAARYRVSFRNERGAIRHLDRRPVPPAGVGAHHAPRLSALIAPQ
jgi:hypothetical protein